MEIEFSQLKILWSTEMSTRPSIPCLWPLFICLPSLQTLFFHMAENSATNVSKFYVLWLQALSGYPSPKSKNPREWVYLWGLAQVLWATQHTMHCAAMWRADRGAFWKGVPGKQFIGVHYTADYGAIRKWGGRVGLGPMGRLLSCCPIFYY